MSNLAFDFKFVAPKKITDPPSVCGDELQMQIVSEQGIYVFFRGQLFAQYRRDDHYSRNIILVQLFLCHKVPQKILAQVFGLTVPHLSSLIGNYRREGSAGVEDHIGVRINNNQKIKGKITKAIIRQLEVAKSSRPTYRTVAKVLKQKYKVDISWSTIGDWWRQYEREHKAEKELQGSTEPKQETLLDVEVSSEQESENGSPQATLSDSDTRSQVGEQWQPNHVAGSFLLYGMLEKSAFLKLFFTGLRNAGQTGRQCIERVILTLFFSHALRLKSIEQTKRLASAHFGPLVLGDFSRQQSLRYGIDGITAHKKFDEVISQHYKNLGVHTDLGDGIYYTDGHFSCYYGKQAIPKGYDARRQRPARGRNTIYLHNSLGHNILSFESPTNTSLSVDIGVLLEKMKQTYGDVKGKTLFFDRGGFSAKCFKAIKSKEMYFGTYLKHRKKDREIDAELFKVQEVEIEGKKISNRIYEKARQSKSYGSLRTIIFIGKQGKQIPVITTNLDLSAGEIVARLQKRWVEENGFKYMKEHYNIDLLTTYETEQAPDKIMIRPNPERKNINRQIAEKKAGLRELKEQYTTRLRGEKHKEEVTIKAFEDQESKLNEAIKNAEVELGLVELEREQTPSKVTSNLKDESVISSQKRRLFINLVKTMNYNCEKWLQQLFCQHHPKADETLSLIRQVLTQPGRIRQRGPILEVELERLDSAVQARSLDKVLENLKEHNYLRLPDGRELAIWQAC